MGVGFNRRSTQTGLRHTIQIKNNEYLGHKIGINGRSLRQQEIGHTLILTTGGTSATVASTSQITPFRKKKHINGSKQ